MATNLFSLPFGKYLDPNLLGELKVLKRATIETHEPEDLYLTQDISNNDLYCCFDMEGHSSGGPMNGLKM